MISRFFNLADTIGWRFTRLLSTIRMRLTAGAAGVELGKGCRFYGRMKFKKAHTATIRIGSGCTFRSKPTSNLIGIDRPCIFSALMPEAELTIGPGCGFSGTVIGAFRSIRLGGGIRCGANTLITDSDWHPGDPRSGDQRPIVIEDNVWLGAGSTVMKGVTIGRNSVIGAGSVVTKDIPADVIAAGNPCRIIRKLHE